MTVVGFLDSLTVSISSECRSFLLNMCMDAPESTTNSLSSGFVEDDAVKHRTSESEWNECGFVLFFELVDALYDIYVLRLTRVRAQPQASKSVTRVYIVFHATA